MPSQLRNYEKVSIYPLDPDVQEEMLSTQSECCFNWATKDGWPVGVIMEYVWKDGSFWLTASAHRHRIEAVRRDPRVSIVVTSHGLPMGAGKTVTVKGRCIIHEDRETKDWFYPALSARVSQDPVAAENFQKFLDSPMRIVLEVVPEKWITFDGAKMAAHTAGTIDESKLGPELPVDTARFEKELQRRGIK